MRHVVPTWLLVALLAGLPLLACAPLAGSQTASDREAQDQQLILTALHDRRYADAIAATRRAGASRAEIDFAVGVLALEGLADRDARQRPLESAAQAIVLIEAAAQVGYRQAVSALADTFARGVHSGVDGAVLVAADMRLSSCWEAVKAQSLSASNCVVMRTGR